MISETARLLASLELQDKFSQTANAAEDALGGLENKTSLVQRGFGLMQGAAGAVGGAVDHLKGRIGQLISGPLGLLGLAGGIAGVGAFLKGSLDQAKDFALEVGRLSSLTGLNTEQTSRLAGALHHFGIETTTALSVAGLFEKNVFRLAETTKKARDFQDKYGLSLVTSSGHIKDFNTLLLDSSDFFLNKSIPAAQKAAALAAIYGRNWQALLPILSAGRDRISDAEDEAEKLGLTLTKDNLAALTKLKEATRDWGSALGGLKLQIGLAIVPLLTDLTTGATNFLKATDQFGRTGSQRIVGFFKDLIGFGKAAFGVIEHQVVPIIKRVIDGWNNLPAPLKGLLVKGTAGNFAIKFLLGFSPVDIALQVAGAVGGKLAGIAAKAVAGSLGGFLGDFFGRTAAQKLVPQAVEILPGPPIPVFVTNPGFGLPDVTGPAAGAGAAETAAAAGGLGLTGLAALVAGIAAPIIGLLVIPSLTKGEPGSAPSVTSGATLSNGKPVVTLDPTTTNFFTGLMPSFTQKVTESGGKVESAVTRQTAAAFESNRIETDILNDAKAGRLATAHDNAAHAAAQVRAIQSLEQRLIHDPTFRPKVDTAAEFIRILKRTSEFGAKGVGTDIEFGPKTGRDPVGDAFVALVKRLPQQLLGNKVVSGEISRHIDALEQVQGRLLRQGNIDAARHAQRNIDALGRLIGVVDKTIPHFRELERQQERQRDAIRDAKESQANHLRIMQSLERRTGDAAVATSRKDFSPRVSVAVRSSTSVSVNDVVRAVNEYDYAVNTYGGKIGNIPI